MQTRAPRIQYAKRSVSRRFGKRGGTDVRVRGKSYFRGRHDERRLVLTRLPGAPVEGWAWGWRVGERKGVRVDANSKVFLGAQNNSGLRVFKRRITGRRHACVRVCVYSVLAALFAFRTRLIRVEVSVLRCDVVTP